jgi:hypothetical protein
MILHLLLLAAIMVARAEPPSGPSAQAVSHQQHGPCGPVAQLPIVAGASALVGLLMPRVTYGAGVWSGGVVPKEAQKAGGA